MILRSTFKTYCLVKYKGNESDPNKVKLQYYLLAKSQPHTEKLLIKSNMIYLYMMWYIIYGKWYIKMDK